MIKFVVSNKKLLLALNTVPVVKRCFVYDFSALNSIEDESFYNLVFSHIIVSNGLTKTTRSNRFSDLDEITIHLLQQQAGIHIHDTGVSNGVTSLELYDKTVQAGISGGFCISDKYAKIYYTGSSVKKFYDADGNLISVNFLFCHFSPRIGRVFFLSRWLFNLFAKKTNLQKGIHKEIILLAPGVYRKITAGNINLLEFDVFETKAAQPFTFLRCMNVLMPAYFSTSRIAAGVNNLKENLAQDGYLLLGRTDGANVNHASFYIRREMNCRLYRRLITVLITRTHPEAGNTVMNIKFFVRKKYPGYFSIEQLFAAVCANIRARLPHGASSVITEVPYFFSPLNFFKNIFYVRAHQGSINHITGDIHYAILGCSSKNLNVLTIHDCVVLEKYRTWDPRYWVFRILWYEWPMRKADLITVISEKTKTDLITKIGYGQQKLRVVSNFVNDAFVYKPAIFNKTNPTLLFIGSTDNKNLDRILQAITGLTCHLQIVGKISAAQQLFMIQII